MSLQAWMLALAMPALSVAPRAAQDAQVVASPQALVAEGWRSFDAGELDPAQRSFERAAELGSIDAHKGLAEVHRRRGDRVRAEAEFRVLLAARADDVEILRELAGLVALDPGRRDEAAQILERLVALEPADLALRLQLGRVLSWAQHHERARAVLRDVVSLSEDPELTRAAQVEIANSHAWGGEPRRALELYESGLAEGRDAPFLREEANLEFWRGRPARALALFDECGESTGDPSCDARRDCAEHLLGHFADAAVQHFTDSTEWSRTKARVGWLWRDDTDRELRLDLESAWYEDGAGDRAQRELLVGRATVRPTPFVRLDAELGLGETSGDDSTWIGEAAVQALVRDGTEVGVRWRHDDLIDEGSPFDLARYNAANSVGVLEIDELDVDTLQVNLSQALDARTALDAYGALGAISDDNERFERYLGLRRPVWRDEERRVIGRVWYWATSFEESVPEYYSPGTLESYGAALRLEGGSECSPLHLEAGGFWQSGGVSELGYHVDVGVLRRCHEHFQWGGDLHHFVSGERGGDYHATALRLSAGWRF